MQADGEKFLLAVHTLDCPDDELAEIELKYESDWAGWGLLVTTVWRPGPARWVWVVFEPKCRNAALSCWLSDMFSDPVTGQSIEVTGEGTDRVCLWKAPPSSWRG